MLSNLFPFHQSLTSSPNIARFYSRCRWNPIFGSSLIAATHTENNLQLYDAAKLQQVASIEINFRLGKQLLITVVKC